MCPLAQTPATGQTQNSEPAGALLHALAHLSPEQPPARLLAGVLAALHQTHGQPVGVAYLPDEPGGQLLPVASTETTNNLPPLAPTDSAALLALLPPPDSQPVPVSWQQLVQQVPALAGLAGGQGEDGPGVLLLPCWQPADAPAANAAPPTRSLLALLLLAPPPTPPDAAALHLLARHVALLLARHQQTSRSRQCTNQVRLLTALARIATATPTEAPMLTEAAEHIQALCGYSSVEIFLLDSTTSELVLQAHAGASLLPTAGYRQPVNLGIMGRAVQTGQVQRVDDVHQHSDYLAQNEQTRSELTVPIMAGGQVLGLLNLESPHLAGFAAEDVTMLTSAADILAGMITNARLHRRAQGVAILEERNRLARELHDSVTQQLFSMTLTAQAARAHIEKNPQRTVSQLERLQETAAAALAEMRALIYQLRPPALNAQGLVNALQQHVAAVSRREGLRIELSVAGDERLAQGYEQALYRIIQEALNNVVKHAAASHVRVRLDFAPQHVRLRMSDDGRGFDVQAAFQHQPPDAEPDRRHYGLLTMQERAHEIGGTLRLHSTPGGGTEMTVDVPRQEALSRRVG